MSTMDVIFFGKKVTLDQSAIDFIKTGNGIKCEHIHPGKICSIYFARRFIAAMKSTTLLYLIVYFLPLPIFRSKQLKKEPI